MGFIWDDHFTIENNSTLQSWSWSHVAHDFKTGLFDDPRGGDFYRPLIAFVDRIDYSLYGLHPGGYHRSNLLFHILNSLLVMLLVIRLGFSRLAALTTGCLCAVHPINVQDMVMVTGRCGLLCMLFTLTTLLFLMKKDVGSLIAAGLAYSLALLAKESALAIPFFYLAIVWLQRTQTLREVMVSLRLLLVLSGIYLAVRQFVPVAFTIPLSSRHWLFFMMHAFPQILFSYAKLVLVPLLLYPNRVIAPTQAHWLLFAGLFFLFRDLVLDALCALAFFLPLVGDVRFFTADDRNAFQKLNSRSLGLSGIAGFSAPLSTVIRTWDDRKKRRMAQNREDGGGFARGRLGWTRALAHRPAAYGR